MENSIPMADKTNAQRLIDLKATLAAAKPKDVLSLADCASLWGVTKPRFVNKRAEIASFPDICATEGNAHFYPARAALKAMISHIDRHQKASADRVVRQAKLIGNSAAAEALAHHTPAELATLNRIAAELSEREIKQGLYVPVAENQYVAGLVFSRLSEFMSGLSNRIDPHGRLDPSTRQMIDIEAHKELLLLHADMKVLLSDDAIHTDLGKPAGGAGQPRTRRKRA